MKKYFITISILIISTIASGNDLNFEAMQDLGGAIILNREPVHSFNLYRNKNVTYLVLQKEIESDGDHAVWKVIDYVIIENYGKDYTFCYGMCDLNGEFAPEIAAIAKYRDNDHFDEILKAWKADLKSGKIIEIVTKGIVCINEGYGA